MKVLWEVDMQKDFVYTSGALPVNEGKGAGSIISNCKQLVRWAKANDIPILGSVDRHFEDDVELKQFPPHCMDGTEGQEIITELWVDNPVFIERKIDTMGKYVMHSYPELVDLIKITDRKLIFEKQNTDVFTNPNVEYVLEKLNVTEAIVYGVATDICVMDAVRGLLKRGIEVSVVADATEGLNEDAYEHALDEMEELGAKLVTTYGVIEDD